LELFGGEMVKKPKNAYGAHKHINFKKCKFSKCFLPNFQKKISPETVERKMTLHI
jgi:hypothetical protein